MSGDYERPTSPVPDEPDPRAPTSLAERLMTRRSLLIGLGGAAGLGVVGVAGILATRDGGGSTTALESPSTSATSTRATSTRPTTTRTAGTTSATTTTSTTTAATTTTSRPPTTTTSRPPTTTSRPPTTTSRPPTTTTQPTTTTPPPPPPAELHGEVNDQAVIRLTDHAGKKVKQIPAGAYVIHVSDTTAEHNFHLFGPGVDQLTSVEEPGSPTWNVTFVAGGYKYQCDPHAEFMFDTFTVT